MNIKNSVFIGTNSIDFRNKPPFSSLVRFWLHIEYFFQHYDSREHAMTATRPGVYDEVDMVTGAVVDYVIVSGLIVPNPTECSRNVHGIRMAIKFGT